MIFRPQNQQSALSVIEECSSFGYCSDCADYHTLGEGNARKYCLELMQMLEEKRRIDFMAPDDAADSHFSTDYLFGDARGQMFGVLECEDENGVVVVLRAFSCQYNGVWNVDGWVPPLLDVDCYNSIVPPVDRQIKNLGRKIDDFEKSSPEHLELVQQRRKLSRELMKDIHGLYLVHSFTGKKKTLFDAFHGAKGIPTGTGDCCAPKLLNHAAKNGLKPLGLAEFYWGRESRSGTRQHGEFYSCCENKCQPILGFMLCGIE